jgi:hypothetical protein
VRRLVLTTLVVVCSGASLLLAAAAGARVVTYHGFRVAVPHGWPVFRLASRPHACVRFDRHAVYLGTPGADERCPVRAVGRTEAILISPGAVRLSGAAVRLRVGRVFVTATVGRHPGLVSRALGRRVRAALPPTPHPRSVARAARAASAHLTPGAVFTGLGFDACAVPSPSTMQAWSASYHAIGIYIGGTNAACLSPNLTSAWVGGETVAGWRFIPTYVGLQAPANGCGCAGIVPAQAAAEGTAAASDAVAQAQALGIGPRNPIYYDMENYNPTTANTTAVLAFLSAWTTQLHAVHYLSGVYSSSSSGIKDIATATAAAATSGSGFVPPDDLWIANWNGVQSTADPAVPSTLFASHDRLHQYAGSHNETHGGVTINIDNDYLDGATAVASLPGAGGIPVPAVAPTLALAPAVDGTVAFHASWPGVDTIGGWQVLAGSSPAALSPLGTPVTTTGDAVLKLRSMYPYFAAQALDASGQPLGTSVAVPTPPHLAIYGHSAFVGSRGNGTFPVGCFTGRSCRITTTITSGPTVLARTGGEIVQAGGARILHFSLTPAARTRLAQRGRLAVRVATSDASGAAASTSLNLVSFAVGGRGPARAVTNAPTVQVLGTTDFVFRRRTGGILAGCFTALSPCQLSVKLYAGRTLVGASPAPQALGANEAGYVRFVLTGTGRTLLARAHGNQLGARLTLVDQASGATSTAQLALVNYR